MAYISTAEEGGGGNRISEEQIKSYLENTLGEAPRPVWGCPGGWGSYLCGAAPGRAKCTYARACTCACVLSASLAGAIGTICRIRALVAWSSYAHTPRRDPGERRFGAE